MANGSIRACGPIAAWLVLHMNPAKHVSAIVPLDIYENNQQYRSATFLYYLSDGLNILWRWSLTLENSYE